MCESLGRNSFSTTMFNPGRTCTKIANVCIPSCGQRACFTWTLDHHMDYALGLYWELDSFTHIRTMPCLYCNHNDCWSDVNTTFYRVLLSDTAPCGGMASCSGLFLERYPYIRLQLVTTNHNKYASGFAFNSQFCSSLSYDRLVIIPSQL